MGQPGRRDEGLRELAAMIAEAYRRRATGEIIGPLRPKRRGDIPPIAEDEIVKGVEPAASGEGFVYTETVRVECFTRRRAPKADEESKCDTHKRRKRCHQ